MATVSIPSQEFVLVHLVDDVAALVAPGRNVSLPSQEFVLVHQVAVFLSPGAVGGGFHSFAGIRLSPSQHLTSSLAQYWPRVSIPSQEFVLVHLVRFFVM